MARERRILVTGCSSGIGWAVARRAAREGYRVFATARDPGSLAPLSKEGVVEPLGLDVADGGSVARAFEEVRRRAGGLDVLVNNAGYAQMGTVEDIPMERWKAEYEVNVFGLIRTTQAALPLLREAGGGTIVNIGSIAGRISYPFGGAYCSSKYAVEAITDALRLEVERFGIRVVLLEPGPTTTNFGQRVEQEVRPLSENGDSPYRELYDTGYRTFRRESRVGAISPDAVAARVLRAAGSRRPATRYLLTWPARSIALLKRFLPDRALDALMRRKFRG